MLFRKTRDLVVETCTIVKGIEKRFDKLEEDFEGHVGDGVEKYDNICKIIKECHESCPESEKFDKHTKVQNGTLTRMEKKYDAFFNKQEILEKAITGIKAAKKTKKELLAEIGKIVTVVCIILGVYFTWQRHVTAKKQGSTQKIEIMLEKLIKQ